MKKSVPYTVKTRYDLPKRTKRENYAFLNTQYCKMGQTVLFGDSITEIFNTHELFADYTKDSGICVYNRGISGDTSDRLLERLADNALNLHPAHLVILIGTNDIGLGIPTQTIAQNVQEILRQVQQNSPQTHIVLEAVYPVNRTLSAEAMRMVGRRKNAQIRQLNAALSRLAQACGVDFLDLTAALCDRHGKLSKSLCYDGLHLNAHGFCVVAQHLIPYLRCCPH